MYTKSSVKFLAVRIEKAGDNCPIGSGVVWTAESEYVYIFTAKHVVEKAEEIGIPLLIRYLDNESKEFTLDVQEIQFHKIDNMIDAAVLRCYANDENLFVHDVEVPTDDLIDKKILIYGFPVSCCDNKSFALSKVPIEGTFLNYDDAQDMFSYRVDVNSGINFADRNEEIVGFSGSGVFVFENNIYKLIGIHCRGAGDDSNLNIIHCVSIKSIMEICSQNNWDVPQQISAINGDLRSHVGLSMTAIENDDFNRSMMISLQQDYSDVIKSDFCGYAKRCDHEYAYHKCKNFRAHLLILVTILKIIKKNIDLTSPNICCNDSMAQYPIKFICSEGLDECIHISISNFVKSLKTDYSKRETISKNSLVIWNSSDRVERNSVCTKSKFDKIIADITVNDAKKGFDIVAGMPNLQGVAIVHMENLIEQVNNGNLENLENWLIEQMQ